MLGNKNLDKTLKTLKRMKFLPCFIFRTRKGEQGIFKLGKYIKGMQDV